jgi:hypothetical protein
MAIIKINFNLGSLSCVALDALRSKNFADILIM